MKRSFLCIVGWSLGLGVLAGANRPLLAGDSLALQITPSPQARPALAAIAPPPVPVPLDTALFRATNDLLSKAKIDEAVQHVDVVIDPLIDGVTGAQSQATLLEQKRIVDLMRLSYPRYRLLPFTVESLLKRPIVLVGTFTAINNAGTPGGPRDAYRICLAFADLRNQTIVSKGVARALPDGVDPTPIPFFRDSPVFARDPATEAYVKTCQGTKVGDPVDDGYTDRILAAAQVNEAIEAYNAGRYKAALEMYQSALKMPGGEQLRVFSGIYLAAIKLGRTRLAMQAFGRMIDFGLRTGDRLAMKFLFKPGSTQFYSDPSTPAPYRAWIGKLAERTATNRACQQYCHVVHV